MSEAAFGPRRLHPATLLARWLRVVPQMLAVGIGLAATGRSQGLGRFLILALVMLAIGGVLAFIYWWRFRYTLGPNEIVIEKGLLQRQRRVIPFDRVQDIAIEQRLLARLFGTAKVRIETGGAAKDEGNLDMIALADARALRDFIRHGARPAEAAAPAARAEEPILFAMDLKRLLFSGLFGFSLIFLAAISAAVQQLDQLGIVEWEQFFTPERADKAAHLVSLRLGLGLAALVIMLGVIAGIVRTVARDFGFALTRTEAGLRRKRGLFTLSEVVIPIRRTQVAVIESGPIARALGWYRLSFQTLGADRKEGGVQVAAPFARMEEIMPILAEAGFPPPPPRAAFRGAPARALVRKIAPPVMFAVPLAAAAFFIDPIVGIGAAAMALLALAAALRWRSHGHAADERALYVTGGLLRRRLRVLPYEKTQTISVSRGPVQRPLRLATLLVDTAGATAMHNVRMIDLDEKEAEAEADRLYRAFLAARALIKAKAAYG
ncbi:MAG TPA: PH domain-containing protein [Allosphingosinicella sp.]|nr:PH domain-containing protein [Allosphingosinicella sp.]